MAREALSSSKSHEELRPLLEIVGSLFYIDPLDRPDLVPLVHEAISLVSDFGHWVIPYLVEDLDAGDVKAQLAVAAALGRMGPDAIAPLVAQYEKWQDPERRSFILYALGKIKSPRIGEAAHLALESASSENTDLRDTAVRAIGKFAESIPAGAMEEGLRADCVTKLQEGLADENPGVRAKAVRGLGKLSKFGHLNAEERKKVRETCDLILGKDKNFEWDRAFLVRREAEETLKYL
jgi:HEAT repeat protein